MTGLSASTLFRAYLGAASYHQRRQANYFRDKLTEKLEANEKELAELRNHPEVKRERTLKDILDDTSD